MFKILLLITAILLFLNGADTCKACHSTIYKENSYSIHTNATYKDEIFNAVWSRHPLKKENKFTCAKCHSPNRNSKKGSISCEDCHKIKEISKKHNEYENIYIKRDKYFYSANEKKRGEKIIFKEKSSLFGLIKSTVGSPYHDIDYSNDIYYNGKACLGCHASRKSKSGFEICSLGVKEQKGFKESCISCHMPKSLGSYVNLLDSKTHTNHNISLRDDSYKLLAKYIDLNITKDANSAKITIKNYANHTLFVHPLRVGQLRVYINGKLAKSFNFNRVIGKNGKATMPWSANSVLKDTTIKAFEKREVKIAIKDSDKIEAELGYYIIDPKAAKKLGIKDKSLLKFRVLKRVKPKICIRD